MKTVDPSMESLWNGDINDHSYGCPWGISLPNIPAGVADGLTTSLYINTQLSLCLSVTKKMVAELRDFLKAEDTLYEKETSIKKTSKKKKNKRSHCSGDQ